MTAFLSRRAFMVAATGACLAAAFPALGCSSGQKTQGNGTLTVGVRSDIVGFSLYNETTGTYYGLEIDLARELASRLGFADTSFVSVTPDSRKETLLVGDVDCLIACYSVSESREQNFDFSPSYYTDSLRLMVENSTLIASVSDLQGATIGTVAGANTAPLLLQEFVDMGFSTGEVVSGNEDNTDVQFDTWHLLEFGDYEALARALEIGQADAVAMDGSIAKTYASNDRSFVDGFEASPQEYAVATQKDSDLSARISAAMQQMIDDGTVAALVEKWN